MTLAKLSYYAFDVATVTLFIGFILLVVHTTLLAAGRRQSLATVTAGGPSSVSVGTGGSSDTPAGSVGQIFVWASAVLLAIGLLVRAYLVGRGPWGNLY